MKYASSFGYHEDLGPSLSSNPAFKEKNSLGKVIHLSFVVFTETSDRR